MDSKPAAAASAPEPTNQEGGGSGRRRGRSGGGQRSRTPRKEGSAKQQQQSSTDLDEDALWETPVLDDERKEALNWQQTMTTSSPQPKGTNRSRKQRPALPSSAASAPPVPGQHAPFVDLASQADSKALGAPTWQQALFKSSTSQPVKAAPSSPAGVLNIAPSSLASKPGGGGNGGRGKRQRAPVNDVTSLADTTPSLAPSSTSSRQQQQQPIKHAPPHLAPHPPTAPAAMRRASLPAEDAAAMYAGPDYHSSPAAEDLPRPRFPPRVR